MALVDDLTRWQAAGTLDAGVADALVSALHAAYPEPAPAPERGKGNGGKGKGDGGDDD